MHNSPCLSPCEMEMDGDKSEPARQARYYYLPSSCYRLASSGCFAPPPHPRANDRSTLYSLDGSLSTSARGLDGFAFPCVWERNVRRRNIPPLLSPSHCRFSPPPTQPCHLLRSVALSRKGRGGGGESTLSPSPNPLKLGSGLHCRADALPNGMALRCGL